MSDDRDLDMLTARKMMEMRRRLKVSKAVPKSDKEFIMERLVDRGSEVLEAAEASYPKETAVIVKNIADVIKKGIITGYISGGELLWLFRRLGLNVSVETKILVEDLGKFVSLADKLRKKE